MTNTCRIIAALLCLLLLLTGCTTRRAISDASSGAQSGLQQSPAEESSPVAGPSQPEAKESAYHGKYVYRAEGVLEEYAPTLELYPNSTFLYRVNLLTGMGNISGSYRIDNARILLEVETLDFKGFTGDGVTEIVFLPGEGMVTYTGDDDQNSIGMTQPDDVFYRVGEAVLP